MTAASSFRISTMRRADIRFAIELAANEGWNPGLHDADSFFEADPDGFLLGLLDGEPIGCISAVRYPGNFGFIGLYIIAPVHRGKGYGIRLWRAAMERLAGCNVGLDGVVAQQDNYRRSGFELAYSNIRFECAPEKTATARGSDHDESMRALQPSDAAHAGGAPVRSRIVPLDRIPFDTLAAFDRTAFPSERRAFLKAWIAQPDSAAHAAVAGDALVGYGVIRRCRQGSKIGPLFARDAETADRLYCALARHANGGNVYLDVPEVNAAAMALARQYGMRQVFGTARMYTRARPAIDIDRVFGVTTFELG